MLNITVYYFQKKFSSTNFFSNLGAFSNAVSNSNKASLDLPRANNIKQQLVAMGIPAKQITTSALLFDEDVFHGDTLMKGGNYSFFAIEDVINEDGVNTGTKVLLKIKYKGLVEAAHSSLLN